MVTLIGLAGCDTVQAERRVDATTLESAEETYNEMFWALPEAERQPLEDAAILVAIDSICVDRLKSMSKAQAQTLIDEFAMGLHGMSAPEILAQGNEIRRDRPIPGFP